MATYLSLVNKVLVKMREAQVSSIDQTEQSALIGQFVNDAKEEVEANIIAGKGEQDINVAAKEIPWPLT